MSSHCYRLEVTLTVSW